MLDGILEVLSQFLHCLGRNPSFCFPTTRLFCLSLNTSNDSLSHEKAALFKKTSNVWNILLFNKPESTSLLFPPITLSSSALWINSTDVFFVFKYKHSIFILGLTKNKSLKPIDTRGAENGTLQS